MSPSSSPRSGHARAGGKPIERVFQCIQGAGLLEHVPVGLRGNGESVRHPDALRRQLPIHLPERGVLASDGGTILDADVQEKTNVAVDLGHGLCVLFEGFARNRGTASTTLGSNGASPRIPIGTTV